MLKMKNVTRKKFDFIKVKYGHFASWAVWAHEVETPKSNMGDLTVLDPEINKNLLSELNPNVIMVALNFSKNVKHEQWGNFHSNRPMATDYKTRYALRGSSLWGAYMTDIIKDYPEKESDKVIEFLKHNKAIEEKNVEFFRQELRDIGATDPLLVAFGNAVFDILKRYFKGEFKIIKIPHYAHFISKEKYREQVVLAVNDL
ncbi:MAG TPA: hypothetical protein VI933_00560 [archaeon]|nr:hypothetical protein [archaeon]